MTSAPPYSVPMCRARGHTSKDVWHQAVRRDDPCICVLSWLPRQALRENSDGKVVRIVTITSRIDCAEASGPGCSLRPAVPALTHPWIRVCLDRAATSSSESSRLTRRTRILTVAVVTLTTAMLAGPALAATSQSNVSTVNVAPPALLSLTVSSPDPSVFANCTGGSDPTSLAIPGGQCSVGGVVNNATVGGVTIAMTGVDGQVFVNGAGAVPSDNGTPWAIGAAAAPDTYTEYVDNNFGESTDLSATPSCDTSYNDGTCTARNGTAEEEYLTLGAPTSTTNASPTFAVTTTWTAVPGP